MQLIIDAHIHLDVYDKTQALIRRTQALIQRTRRNSANAELAAVYQQIYHQLDN